MRYPMRTQLAAALAMCAALGGTRALAQSPKMPILKLADHRAAAGGGTPSGTAYPGEAAYEANYDADYGEASPSDGFATVSESAPYGESGGADLYVAQNASGPQEAATPDATTSIPGPEPLFLDTPPANTSQPPRPSPGQGAAAKKKLAEQVAGAYKDPFYLNDFSYLDNPAYDDYHLGEGLKRMPVGGGYLDLGGSYRLRYHNEHNIRGLGLTGRDDQFLLDQTRVYGNWKVNDDVRVFAEFLDAGSSFEDFAPRPIEVNQFDMQNLFADFRLLDSADGSLTVRGGRQELLFGSQRLVSPLVWANTRRTFEGGRFTYDNKGGVVVDGFWTRPVRVLDRDSDSPNLDQQFFGFYATNKNFGASQLDTYYLGLLDSLADQKVHTFGNRLSGEADGVLWDFEGAYQYNELPSDPEGRSDGFAVAGLGRKLGGDWSPVLWGYYDWASGSEVTGEGFNQLFPLGHKYLGFMDLFGRRNINDANALLTFKPAQRFSALVWYHYLFLADREAGPYNVTGSAFNPGGNSGSRELGHELDLLGTWAITPRSELLLGYSHFFSGDYYDRGTSAAGTPLFDGDGDFYYVQWLQLF